MRLTWTRPDFGETTWLLRNERGSTLAIVKHMRQAWKDPVLGSRMAAGWLATALLPGDDDNDRAPDVCALKSASAAADEIEIWIPRHLPDATFEGDRPCD